MNSCIYQGQVRHHRFSPAVNKFTYGIYFLMLDLDELETVFRRRWLWSTKRFALAWLRRKDHFKDHPQNGSDLKSLAVDLLQQHGIQQPVGSVRLLTQLRYLGFAMNPVCFYYCYGESNTTTQSANELVAIIAEVNNTPWGEQHHYVIPAQANKKLANVDGLEKQFHVSPFLPMEMEYSMRFSSPGKKLAVRIENFEHSHKKLDVVMSLDRRALTRLELAKVLTVYPLITFKVFAAIYWQALKLYAKRVPFFSHPNKKKSEEPTLPVHFEHPQNTHPQNKNSQSQNTSDSLDETTASDDSSTLVGP